MPKLIQIDKRNLPSESPWIISGLTLLSILGALIIGGILFLPFGVNPINAYLVLIEHGFGNLQGFGFTLVKATPLIFIGLGTIIAWKTGFFFLGFQGSLLIGAAMSVWIALLASPGAVLSWFPPILLIPLIFLGSFFAGGIWAGLAGLLRTKFGGSEVLISLMMNYVALFIVQYLVSGPLRAPGGLPQTERIPESAILPFIIVGTRAHAGILVALAAAVIVWFILRKTPLGYELIVTGLNLRAATFGGININQRLVLAAFIAGGLAGFAGLVEVLGVQYRLLDGISVGTGFVGIVAALLGKLHPLGVVIASTLYAGLEVGADAMQRRSGIPSSVVLIIQSLIVLFILAGDILRYYRVRFNIPGRGETEAASPEDTPISLSER
jgi:general nucleoside transport system permease protein